MSIICNKCTGPRNSRNSWVPFQVICKYTMICIKFYDMPYMQIVCAKIRSKKCQLVCSCMHHHFEILPLPFPPLAVAVYVAAAVRGTHHGVAPPLWNPTPALSTTCCCCICGSSSQRNPSWCGIGCSNTYKCVMCAHFSYDGHILPYLVSWQRHGAGCSWRPFKFKPCLTSSCVCCMVAPAWDEWCVNKAALLQPLHISAYVWTSSSGIKTSFSLNQSALPAALQYLQVY